MILINRVKYDLIKAKDIRYHGAYFKDKPVKKVWIFGSYARNEADEQSDLDVLIDVDYSSYSGWDYFVWHDELGLLLQKKVDVVSLGGVNERLWPYIEKDMSLIYEKQSK